MTMLAMIISGIYIGIATETYNRVKRIWKTKPSLRMSLEIIYWLGQTFILYTALYYVNNGEIRFYVFLSVLCGYSMYVVLFRKLYRALLEKIIRFIRTCARIIYNVLHTVIYRPCKALITFLYRLFLQIIKLALFICNYLLTIVFLPFRWIHFILVRTLPINKVDKYNKMIAFCSTISSKFISLLKRVFAKGG